LSKKNVFGESWYFPTACSVIAGKKDCDSVLTMATLSALNQDSSLIETTAKLFVEQDKLETHVQEAWVLGTLNRFKELCTESQFLSYKKNMIKYILMN